MELDFDKVSALVLQLPLQERVRLAQVLTESVEVEVPLDYDKIWAQEAHRRMQRYEAGVSGGRDVEEAYQELLNSLLK